MSINEYMKMKAALRCNEYMMIKKAARYLGVTPNTLRNWAKWGKIKTHRHPINKYRLYRREDLEELLEKIHNSAE